MSTCSLDGLDDIEISEISTAAIRNEALSTMATLLSPKLDFGHLCKGRKAG